MEHAITALWYAPLLLHSTLLLYSMLYGIPFVALYPLLLNVNGFSI